MNEWTDPEFDMPSAPQSGDREESEEQRLCTKCGALVTYGKELCWWCWQAEQLPPGCVTASEILGYWTESTNGNDT
ncbi:MAG TPA: hypothetical protein VH164_08140 [Ktedonobacteraceae bacterium]|jgi:hypothetical protein|nr:hypothetical protein [Ktedonobacteraceae bacterium]